MKTKQSLLKKLKLRCSIWNALLCLTNIIDHWLLTLVCSKKWKNKIMSFGTHIHSLQSSVFATRRKKKKEVAGAGKWFIVCFSFFFLKA